MKRRKTIAALDIAALDDDTREQLEKMVSQVETLRAMSNENLLTDEELDRFFALILPAQHAERARAAAAVGRSLTQAEGNAAYARAFVVGAGNAAREVVWGASIGELFDGWKPQ